ncbi:MAG: FAD-dependent thymidylate synthase [Patescibacteria group bacterium]
MQDATSKSLGSDRDIFALVGLPPEVLAVAMAKYSRSQEGIKYTIDELTEEKSAAFHEKWVLGYGDASVADMAMVAIALENVSILASKVVEDNRLACFQEKSTRYVPFDPTRHYKPVAILNSHHRALYESTLKMLYDAYQKTVDRMIEWYGAQFPKPEDKTEKEFAAKLRARALDVARYYLPTATLTNFGMIMSARALRHCISKLLGHPTAEMRAIGEEIRLAAINPAYNPQAKKLEPLLEKLSKNADERTAKLAEEIQAIVTLQIQGAPTLVKHNEPKEYLMEKDKTVRMLAEKILKGVIARRPKADEAIPSGQAEPRVTFLGRPIAPEDELVATLLYRGSTLPFTAILERVEKLSPATKQIVIDAVQDKRSDHDWPSREFEVGQYFIFDTLMDYGAFRDLQRHRICTQINQELGTEHGYEIPRDLPEAGLLEEYQEVMERAKAAYELIADDLPHEAQYVIPMAFRKRTLFKMNLREFFHIVELRTKSGGHFSYRALVYEMYEQVKATHPALVKSLRAVKINWEEDFYKR